MHDNYPTTGRAALNAAERTQRVAARFDEAAARYDSQAHLQRRAAVRLAEQIQNSVPAEATERILELGCGTGFLTEQFIDCYPAADWTITDISAKMLELCCGKIESNASAKRQVANGREQSAGQRSYQVLDAQDVDLNERFDLICSNLTFQWFTNLVDVVIKMIDCLRPGGSLVFNTLGSKTFSVWQQLDREVGGNLTAPVFPTVEALDEDLANGCALHFDDEALVEVSDELLEERHASFPAFLHNLQAIGAGSRVGGDAVSTGQLRRLLRHLQNRQNATRVGAEVLIDYQIVTVLIRRRPAAE